ncbi:MAG: serine hydrolase domain-containing protein [Ilumatobacteraceae bacterium]
MSDVLGRLEELVAAAADRHHCPTIAWGVVRNGSLAERGGVGELHDGTTPDERTVYRIASMTKSFTAAAVLALRDEGVLQLDLPVREYAPELGAIRGPDDSPPITLRHLLSMSAGIPTDDPWADRHLDFTMDEIDEVYAGGSLFAFRTGDAYEYSNLGFGMIGRCVRRSTGRTVQEHVTERFLRPLGMSDTTWVEPPHDRWARPFRWQDAEHVLDEPHPIGDGEISPMGGLWTTVADLVTWVGWLDAANAEPAPADGTGLSTASRREMQRMHTYIGTVDLAGRSSPTGYGFGLRVRDDAALGMVIAHSGGVPGYGSNMRWVAGTGVGAIALANTTYAPMGELTMELLDALHADGAMQRPVHPVAPELRDACVALAALLSDWDDVTAAQLFADNVALDESFLRRAAAARQLTERQGPLRLVAVHPESATSGDAELAGDGASFRVRVELGPMVPAKVQAYHLPD